MAKAIFTRDFNWSSRTRNIGFSAKASPEPQTFPRDFIAAAVEAGVAEIVPPRRTKKTAVKTDKD